MLTRFDVPRRCVNERNIMSWTLALISWSDLLDQLCNTFNHLDRNALIRFRGNRAQMNLYLAETHDLTLAEASEALDDWLVFSARNTASNAAA